MNKYYDIYLDQNGAAALSEIIDKNSSKIISDEKAVEKTQKLIKKYPNSPQLRISKSIFLNVKFIQDKFYYWEKAIELDSGFYHGYRMLSQGQMASAWKISSSNTPINERMNLHPILFELNLFAQNNHVSQIPEFLDKNPELLDNKWEELFNKGLLTLSEGLNKMDINRYPEEQIEAFRNEYNMLKHLSNYQGKAKVYIMQLLYKIL